MKGLRIIVFVALICAALWAVFAQQDPAADMRITQTVVRPLTADTAAVVLSIDNGGGPDRLMGVASPTGSATLYSPVDAAGLPVPSGLSSLALDGAHIQLAMPSGSVVDGALIPLELTFQNAGTISLKARMSDPAKTGAATEVGLFGAGDICVVGDGEPAPEITVSVLPDGDGWTVRINAVDFTFSEDLVGLYHVPGVGHGHLYVGGMKLGRLYAPQAHIGALPKGSHEIRVTLNTNDHRAYVVDDVPVTATATIVVD
ncbi:hypothetical protein [uncultured Roseobacter sp.]|uniref:hypothetical protein n=1 Tax=uncultured Roseobacter sp. TaxID=114847 RepID=UPI002635535F|nr:hypothetical protein [uncultured Roseobacter sp.]